jgi:hypothetical protein
MAMRTFRITLLAGTAAIGLAGFSGLAAAQAPQTHVMTVALPDGGTAQIRYTGDVPPRVSFGNAPLAVADWPGMPALFGTPAPFAMLDRILAEMDHEAAAMFRRAAALSRAAQSGQALPRTVGTLPPGGQSYTFVSETNGNGVCSQSVEITSAGNGPPKVVRHSSGNCGPATAGATPGAVALPSASAPGGRPDTLWIDNANPPPARGLIQKTAWPH